MEGVCHYLQPVMEAAWALLSVHALDVEVVSEVKRDSEARSCRNDVLTGHSMRWGVRVSWTEQVSLWLIKYTTTAGYWEIRKGGNHSGSPPNEESVFIPQLCTILTQTGALVWAKLVAVVTGAEVWAKGVEADLRAEWSWAFFWCRTLIYVW